MLDFDANEFMGKKTVLKYTDIFDNTKQSECPVINCFLFQQGCQIMIQSSYYVSLSGTPPVNIDARVNETLGYIMSICVICMNSFNVQVKIDDFIISQARKVNPVIIEKPVAVPTTPTKRARRLLGVPLMLAAFISFTFMNFC